MKILVRDEGQSAFGAIQVKIKDLSSELEKITVRVLRLGRIEKLIPKIDDVIQSRPTAIRPRPRPTIVRPIEGSPQPAPRTPVVVPHEKIVEVKLSLPSLSLSPSYKKIRKRFSASPKKSMSIALLCLAIIATGIYAPHLPIHTSTANTTGVSQITQPLTQGTPSYATLLPVGKTATDLGGWTRISPANRDPVYAFVDKIGTVQVTVSEQPLPAKLEVDPATQVAQLAQNFSATDKFTAGGTTAYIGTSAQGPQSVILTKKGLLVLIKSTYTLTNDQWAAYITSLQ